MGKSSSIGKLNESLLHNSLKFMYSKDTKTHEQKVGRYHIDVKLPDELVEIQTANLGTIKTKIANLLKKYKVRVVIPIIAEKYIYKYNMDETLVSKRKSPKKQTKYDIYEQLLRIPNLLSDSNLIIEGVVVKIKENWLNDGQGSWRRKRWSKTGKELLEIIETFSFSGTNDYIGILPSQLPSNFTTYHLAGHLNTSLSIAQKICYTYSKAGFIIQVGRDGRNKLYSIE